MKHTAVILLCAVIVLNLTACSAQDEAAKQGSAKFEEEKTGGTKEALFPVSYTGGTEVVKFDCDLEIPEEFDPQNFYIPKVSGVQYIDRDAAYAAYVAGKEIKEEYHYPQDDKNVPMQDIYILEDGTQAGTQVIIDKGINYYSSAAAAYSYVMRDSEVGASKENLPFGTGEECVSQIKEALADMDFPVDEFLFSWFSLSSEEHIALEQEKLEKEEIGPENMRTDWTAVEGNYEIFAWQIYGGLPVFPTIMSNANMFAFESYKNAPVSAIFSDQGMLSLDAETPYAFEKTDELASFLPFSEIVSAIEEKYDQLLIEDGVIYTVQRAKLVVRTYIDETQSLTAEPVWYFEVADSKGDVKVMMFQALTGKEIFLY